MLLIHVLHQRRPLLGERDEAIVKVPEVLVDLAEAEGAVETTEVAGKTQGDSLVQGKSLIQ